MYALLLAATLGAPPADPKVGWAINGKPLYRSQIIGFNEFGDPVYVSRTGRKFVGRGMPNPNAPAPIYQYQLPPIQKSPSSNAERTLADLESEMFMMRGQQRFRDMQLQQELSDQRFRDMRLQQELHDQRFRDMQLQQQLWELNWRMQLRNAR